MSIRTLLLIVVVCGVTGAAGAALTQQSGSTQTRSDLAKMDRIRQGIPDTSPQIRGQQEEARRRFGLAAAASVTGVYIGRAAYASPAGGPASLDELADISDVIVIGTIGENLSVLTSDEKSISMLHRLSPTQTIKGPKLNQDLVIVFPGGRVSFDNGDWAELQTPGFITPLPGDICLLFLRRANVELLGSRASDAARAFVPVTGPTSVYLLSSLSGAKRSEIVFPSGNHRSVLGQAIMSARMNTDQFIEAVRVAAR